MLALRAVIDAKPDVFNHNAETTSRLVFVRALTAIARAFVWVPFARRAGSTLSWFPSSKTTNEEWTNRQQRNILPASFSVCVLLMSTVKKEQSFCIVQRADAVTHDDGWKTFQSFHAVHMLIQLNTRKRSSFVVEY
jgi:hypothetical protein